MTGFPDAGGLILRSHPRSAQVAAGCLRSGGICILPTDTVYGLSGLVPGGRERLRAIKGRGGEKPFIQLIADPSDICQYTDTGLPSDLLSLWPGALTVVVPTRDGSTVAFRCPGDGWLRQVIALAGSPIYSTSANRSGRPVLGTLREIREEFAGEVDLLVDGEGSVATGARPSTLVELLPDGGCRILRQGDVVVPPGLLERGPSYCPTAGSR